MTEALMEKTAEKERYFTVRNPANGQEIARYHQSDREDIDRAIEVARAAFASWSKSSFEERKKILLKASSILAENAGAYAEEIALENGKTRTDALLADVYTSADLLRYYAKRARAFLKPVRVPGNIIMPGRKCYYKFEPKGVIGVIAPWNYPLTLANGPVVSAIAAGNTVVLKPSSQTTRSGLILAEVMEKAGLPAGVLQVLTGTGSFTGQALIEHEGLDMLFFTGSTEVGKEVNLKAAEHLIPAAMELGGKDVCIVTKNAHLDRAARGVATGCFFNTGQTCIATEVILVDREVYDPFMEKLSRLVSHIKPGKEVGDVGSMTMESQLDIVKRQLKDALDKGAKIIAKGGESPDREGFWCTPVLLGDVTPDMEVVREETFGPLKPVIPYDTLDEAIELANGLQYGLSGSVFSRDIAEARMIADRLKTGSVNINDVLLTFIIHSLPFGGVKKSGMGRYHGKMGIQAFTDIKSMTEYRIPIKGEIHWWPAWPGVDKIFEGLILLLYAGGLTQRLQGLISLLRRAPVALLKSRHWDTGH